MNIDIARSIQQPRVDKKLESNKKEDTNKSFLQTFKKLMDKKKLEDGSSKKSSKDSRLKDLKKEDLDKESLANNPFLTLVNNYPGEKGLNFNLLKESLEELKIDLEAIDVEDRTALEGLFKVEKLLGEELEELSVGHTKNSSAHFNFNLEEIKNNLRDALGKTQEAIEEFTRDGEGRLGVDKDKIFNLEEVLIFENLDLEEDFKLEDIFRSNLGLEDGKEDRLGILKEIKSQLEDFKIKSKVGSESTRPIKSLEDLSLRDIDLILDKINVVLKDQIDLDEIKDMDLSLTEDLIGKDPETGEDLEFIDTSLLFNRIQGSILGLRNEDDAFSIGNLEGIEDSIIKFMNVSKEGDTSTMRVKLYPEELGSVDVSLKLQDGKLIGDIVVESEKIKALFLNNTNLLSRNLANQNIDVKSLNISVKEDFNSFENFDGSLSDKNPDKEEARELNKALNKHINNTSIDEMRIEKINKQGEGLNILA